MGSHQCTPLPGFNWRRFRTIHGRIETAYSGNWPRRCADQYSTHAIPNIIFTIRGWVGHVCFQSRVVANIVYYIVHSMNFCTQEDFAATKLCSDFWRVYLIRSARHICVWQTVVRHFLKLISILSILCWGCSNRVCRQLTSIQCLNRTVIHDIVFARISI